MWKENVGDAKWNERSVISKIENTKSGTIINTPSGDYLLLPNGKAAEIASYREDGTPVLRVTVERKEEGFDDNGNKKVSTVVGIVAFDLQLQQKSL